MRRILMLLTLVLAGGTVALAAPDMQDGLWEITTRTEMAGVPFSMPTTSYRQCITRQDLVPWPQEPQQECEMLHHETEGDAVLWTVRCTTGDGTMTSNGRITYHGDRFEGVIHATGEQMPGQMTQTMAGKRIGECQ